MALPDILNTDTAANKNWSVDKEKTLDVNFVWNRYYAALEAAQERDQASLVVDSFVDNITIFIKALYSINIQLDDEILYEYDYHTKPISSETFMGKFKFTGKGKTKFHVDVE